VNAYVYTHVMSAQNIANCFPIGTTIKSITKWQFSSVKFECMKIHFNANLKNSNKITAFILYILQFQN
jgi:hypothetical protein